MQPSPQSGAILQRDRKTLAIVPHIPCGVVSPNLLRRIAEVGERYGCVMKITAAGRIALVGLTADNVAQAWRDLGMDPGAAVGMCVRNVRACPGTLTCRRAVGDALALGMEFDGALHGEPTPGPTKVAVSGCGNDCTGALQRDFGMVATKSGWKVVIGGNGGSHPRIGRVLAAELERDHAKDLFTRALATYRKLGRCRERVGATIERVGIDAFELALAQT